MGIFILISLIYITSIFTCRYSVRKAHETIWKGVNTDISDVIIVLIPVVNTIFSVSLIYDVLANDKSAKDYNKFFGLKD